MKPRRTRPYHLLLTRETATDKWGVAFGDYDRPAVVFERAEYRQRYMAKNLTIISAANARGKTVQAAVDALNASIGLSP